MVGHITPNMRAGLKEIAIGIGTRDPARMINGYQTLDVLLPEADLDQIQKMEAKVFDRFWGKSMRELQSIQYSEMREFANEFREVIASAPFQIPQNLILLGRTAAILSGMCTGLDPQFNVWEGFAPFAEDLIQEEALDFGFWAKELTTSLLGMVTLPSRMRAVIGRIERGELSVQTPKLVEQVNRLELTVRRLAAAIVFAVLAYSGTQLYISGERSAAIGFFAVAGIAGIMGIATARK
jgi:predicted unusual protein kinase regulating ubiquinone biosynthesis (AarF/ABC1/UbiB family)